MQSKVLTRQKQRVRQRKSLHRFLFLCFRQHQLLQKLRVQQRKLRQKLLPKIQVMMIHVLAEIAVAVVVDVVAVKVEQILPKLRVRIQQQQRMIQKNQPRIAAAAVVAHLVKALYRVKPLKKMA
jgi:hypothetical protein